MNALTILDNWQTQQNMSKSGWSCVLGRVLASYPGSQWAHREPGYEASRVHTIKQIAQKMCQEIDRTALWLQSR